MNIANDTSCGWINDLDKRSNIKTLDKDKSCDWLIVGGINITDMKKQPSLNS